MSFSLNKDTVKKSAPIIAGPLLIILSTLVMIGWFVKSPFLVRLSKSHYPMAFNSALSFLCVGVGLLFVNYRWKWVTRILSIFVFLLNFFIVMEYIFSLNLYVDDLFYKNAFEVIPTFSQRTPLNLALTLTLASFSIFLLTLKHNIQKTFLIILFSCIGLAIPFANIIGYISGIESAASWAGFSKMSLSIAISTILINLCVVTIAITDILGTPIQGKAIAIAISLATVISTAGFWRLVNTKDYIAAQTVSEYEANEINSVSNQILRENVDALKRFAERWEVEGGYSPGLWQRDSGNYMEDLKPLTSLQIVNTQFQVIEQTATIKNTTLPNQELYTSQLELMKLGEVAYFFNSNREELEVFIPIFKDNALYEFLFASLDLSTVFQMAVESIPESKNTIIFTRDNYVLYSWNIADNKTIGPPTKSTITDSYIPITLLVSVSKNTDSKGSLSIQLVIILTGIFAAVISAGIVYYYFNAKEKGATLDILNKDLELAKEKANQAALAKSTFLASMSHEIRTPLNAIIGTLQVLEEGQLDETQKKYIRRMDFSSKNLLSLLNDLLDYSKIEAGNIQLENSPFDVLDVLREACETIILKAAEKKVPLYLEAPEQPLPMVMGDPHRLQQILINFLTNAFKFTNEGQVVLKLQIKQQEANLLSLHFEVVDSGIGISSANQSKLFKKFSQVEASHARRSKGVGLGLSICKSLVEKMQGQIGVQSEEGKGATFWFDINFQIEKPGENPPPYQLDKASILVLDQDTRQKELLIKYLNAWNAQVIAEYSETLENIQLAILSTDQGDLIQKIKDKNIPILYLENSDPSRVGDDLLQKPVSPKSLWGSIQNKRGK